ncbi:MAG: ImmA/IrrE family metallo-endopeptidase [Oscillospiraceae bacterium]|nr:ImmA/IrrE family metallo-endopeptidase [Oscillospiraceae bacterium]
MILSYGNLEEIAVAVAKDLYRVFDYKPGKGVRRPWCTPIEKFATDYLGLDVSFAKLSPDGSICGLTAYVNTWYEIDTKEGKWSIPLKQNQVLLDESFMRPGQVEKLCGKRRFTLAHECAHQILYQFESEENKCACRKQYAARKSYSPRNLKTREDWNEWQANVLGAAILIPQREIELAMLFYSNGKNLTSFEEKFCCRDQITLDQLCDTFGVSRTAVIIRLRHLGYLDDRPRSEFYGPIEAIA